MPRFSFMVAVYCLLYPVTGFAEGITWEPFLAFPPSASGRTDAVAIVSDGTIYMLGGQPYRCNNGPCGDP